MKYVQIILPLYMYLNFCNFKKEQKLQPTVTTFVVKIYDAKIAAKPIPSISAAAISIAVWIFPVASG